jgi:hypothetical protein
LTEPESDALARRYAELERSLEPQRMRSIARGPIGLIGVLVVLSLAVGTVAAIDLRRLQTPRGTALAWTGAAVFGDCIAYERLSIVEGDEERTDAEICARLVESTLEARQSAATIGIDVVSIEQRDREATVAVVVRRDERNRIVELPLRRKGDGWGVVLTDEVCDAVGCP